MKPTLRDLWNEYVEMGGEPKSEWGEPPYILRKVDPNFYVEINKREFKIRGTREYLKPGKEALAILGFLNELIHGGVKLKSERAYLMRPVFDDVADFCNSYTEKIRYGKYCEVYGMVDVKCDLYIVEEGPFYPTEEPSRTVVERVAFVGKIDEAFEMSTIYATPRTATEGVELFGEGGVLTLSNKLHQNGTMSKMDVWECLVRRAKISDSRGLLRIRNDLEKTMEYLEYAVPRNWYELIEVLHWIEGEKIKRRIRNFKPKKWMHIKLKNDITSALKNPRDRL